MCWFQFLHNLMIIHDFNLMRIRTHPFETNSPLLVDADAVLICLVIWGFGKRRTLARSSATLIQNVLVKPGFRVGPVSLHGFGGDAERFGDLLVLQAREEP